MRIPIAAALLAAASAPSLAAPLPGTGLEVGASVELMSDYRFRGVSRSDGDPALQAGIVVSHSGGLYAGARGTTLQGLDGFRLRNPAFRDLGAVQLELYAGYGADLGRGFSADGGLLYHAFPDGEGATGHFEPYASASYLIGPLEATLGARYAWGQRATGDEDMLYLFGELEAGIPFTPVTLTAQAGRQDWGRFGSYWNWSLGGSYALGPARLGLRYVDTDLPGLPGQDSGLVFSLGFRF